MTPAEFLALTRRTAAPAAPSPRAYAALVKSDAAETFLTLHTSAGRLEALPYSALQFISGDEAGATLRLIFTKMAVSLHGRQLLPVFEALRTRIAAHLYEFIPARHDLPEADETVIAEIEFAVEQIAKAS